jgi:hypothetical protein
MKMIWGWLTERSFRIATLLATILLLITIILRGNHYLSESRFAVKKLFPIWDGTFLEVVHPTLLEVVPFAEAKRQIFVNVAGYLPATPIQLTIDFSGSEGLVFSDSEGNGVSSVIILDTSQSINSASIYVRPEPLLDDSQDQASLNISIKAIQDGSTILLTHTPYTINIQNPDGLAVGYWLNSVLSDIGLPLGFAIAVLGWAIEYSNRQKEEASKERLSLVQSLREIAKTDPIEAMQRLLEYEKIKNMEESLVVVLKTMRQQFESREHLGELLYLAGEAIERGDYQKTEQILIAMDTYLCRVDVLDSRLILPCLIEIPKITGNKAEIQALLIPVLQLWSKYDEYSRRVVVHVIHHVCKTYKENAEMIEMIKKALNNIDQKHRKRLLRDPEIKVFAPELASLEKYDWAESPLAFSLPEHVNTAAWLQLEENRLRQNPFTLVSVEHLRSISLPPREWHDIQSPRSMMITSNFDYDRELLLRYLETYLQVDASSVLNVFPVCVTLELASTTDSLSPRKIADEIISSVATAWIRLISKNPGAFLNLPRPKQYAIAEFLAWKAGTTASLQIWLRQNGLKDTFAGNMVFRRIREVPEKVIPETITNEKLFEWMAVKPPDLDQTYILVDLRSFADKTKHKEAVKTLFALSKVWFGARVTLKIFSAPLRNFNSNIAQIVIRWAESDIEKSLDTCTTRASRSIQGLKFADLFWPNSYPEGTRLIAQNSHGSLSEALRLGNGIVLNHVRRAHREPHLDISDLDGIGQKQ